MKKLGRRFFIEAFVLLSLGVVIISLNVLLRDQAASNMKIYYFYSPDCPNCKALIPFFKELAPELDKKKIAFVPVSIKNAEKWTDVQKFLALRLMQKMGIDYIPIPTATVWHNGKFFTMVGKDEILGLSGFLHVRAGTKLVKAKLNNERFKVEDCVSCHEARKIPLPSTYNCTYCCHRSKPK